MRIRTEHTILYVLYSIVNTCTTELRIDQCIGNGVLTASVARLILFRKFMKTKERYSGSI